ncbi:MAG: hypothetical protein Wins2KO_04420 [Winogradskyella sp.]
MTLLLDVKMIGSVCVPSAIIFEPLLIVREPLDLKSPRITVPGSMINVALLVTKTSPKRR